MILAVLTSLLRDIQFSELVLTEAWTLLIERFGVTSLVWDVKLTLQQ